MLSEAEWTRQRNEAVEALRAHRRAQNPWDERLPEVRDFRRRIMGG